MLVSIGILEKINKDLDSGFYGGGYEKILLQCRREK